MRIVTVKVDDKLKKRMGTVKINWSEYIREAILRRVELAEKKIAVRKLLEDLEKCEGKVPEGFINKTIREVRGKR